MTPSTRQRILRVDASMRRAGSVSRDLGDKLIDALRRGASVTEVAGRDLADGIALIDEDWIGANFTDAAARTEAQTRKLALSDALVAEIRAADILVIAAPIYNFGVPGALKAWIDQVARAGLTFRYTPDGPVGLLDGKKAYVVVASGGTAVDSPIDFATGYLRHVLGFIGIHDVTVIAADALMKDADAALARADAAIERAALAAA